MADVPISLIGENGIAGREKVITGRKKLLLGEKCIVLTKTQFIQIINKNPRRPNLTRGGGAWRLGQCPNFSHFFL